MEESSKINHSTSHILAYAVKLLYPNIKFAIGPSIENGFYYDFDNLEITNKDLSIIEKKMQELINRDVKFEKLLLTRNEAKKRLKDQPYKLELLDEIKDKEISFYKSDDFIDLCKGPHITSTKQIKAFKLLRIAGAYWKGSSSNKMLTRIYGTAFTSKKELDDYLKLQEEAEKRNHIRIGKELDLFSMHEEAPGSPFWHNKGMILKNELINLWRELHKKENYLEVQTPIILNKKLWETSGHWQNYKENMYFTRIDDEDFAIKPMNCPGGILIYNEKIHSYKELPIRVAELGLVHRHELSGVLNGLFRVRVLTQDDAHIYCLQEQIENEINNVINLIIKIYSIFGFKEYEFEISTKPEKYVGSDDVWENATKALMNVLKKRKIRYNIDNGAGVFYGPKIDIKIKDALNRKWQCATIQYDFNLPERFNITYEGEDGRKHRPVMIHRTIYGSLERFVGILIEHYEGKFPLWLSPIQAKILTVTDKNKEFASKILNELKENNIRIEIDFRQESIPKKVRDAQLQKIPLVLVIGDKESKNKTLAVRTLDGKTTFGVKLNSFVKKVKKNIEDKSLKISF